MNQFFRATGPGSEESQECRSLARGAAERYHEEMKEVRKNIGVLKCAAVNQGVQDARITNPSPRERELAPGGAKVNSAAAPAAAVQSERQSESESTKKRQLSIGIEAYKLAVLGNARLLPIQEWITTVHPAVIYRLGSMDTANYLLDSLSLGLSFKTVREFYIEFIAVYCGSSSSTELTAEIISQCAIPLGLVSPAELPYHIGSNS